MRLSETCPTRSVRGPRSMATTLTDLTGHGLPGQARVTRGQADVSGRGRALEIAGQGYDDHGGDGAAVETVALDDDHGTAKPWGLSDRLGPSGRVDVPLCNHHGSARSRRRPAATNAESGAWLSP